jgi:hypothetical protein
MAFADPLVLVDNAAVNQNFTRKVTLASGGSDWVEDDATAALERTLVMRHSTAGPSVVKGAVPRQRHLTQFLYRKFSAITGLTETFKVNLTIEDDPSSSITLADKEHILAFVRSFATSANLPKILRAEF